MASAATNADINVKPQDDIVGLSRDVLAALGSLKFTVVLFACSLVIVLVGTLAQDEMNMHEVKQRYFTSMIAMTHVDDFFPQAFFPHKRRIIGVFPFPGGAMIGMLLMLNLVAAKVTRFKINATGTRFNVGMAFLAIGTLIAGAIVFAGHNDEGLQGTPPISYELLWQFLQVAMAGLAAGAVYMGIRSDTNRVIRIACAAIAISLLGYLGYTLYSGEAIGDPGLRIVWQLTKGLGAGILLMIGCILIFGRQGGNMLLHIGVALLMVGQFAFGDRQLEQRLSLVEGESSNALVNLDAIELTFIQSKDDVDTVTAIPGSRLRRAFKDDVVLSHETLPVDVEVMEFFENSTLAAPTGVNPATAGIGLQAKAKEVAKSGGTDSEVNVAAAYVRLFKKGTKESLGVHMVSQLVSDRSLLMPGQNETDEFDEVTVGETKYKLGLRYHREVKPYWVHLEDVRRINYSGTETPRDYSSFIRIIDQETGEDRHERVWMNNPLRYRGETFFQSSYIPLPGGKEATGLQVVRNTGWLIPYVACSITALGMLVHFLGTLSRFLSRRERELAKQDAEDAQEELANDSLVATTLARKRRRHTPLPAYVAGVLAAAFATCMLIPWSSYSTAYRPEAEEKAQEVSEIEKDPSSKFDFYAAGKIPVKFGGRVMPLDAYARQTLKAMSNKESLPLALGVDAYEQDESKSKTSKSNSEDEETDYDKDSVSLKPYQFTGKGENSKTLHHLVSYESIEHDVLRPIRDRVGKKKISAIQWLMEVAIDEPRLRHLPMFRIDADQVRSELKLNRRSSKIYSLNEIFENWNRVSKLVETARDKDIKDTNFKEKKLLALDARTRHYTMATAAFQLPIPPVIPPEFFPPGTSRRQMETFAVQELERKLDAMKAMRSPDLIPPTELIAKDAVNDPEWNAFSPAFFEWAKASINGEQKSRPGVEAFADIIQSYSENNPTAFNHAVDAHLAAVKSYNVPGYSESKVSMERWLQSNWPTGVAMVMYIMALILGLVYLFTLSPTLRSGVFGMLVVIFAIHTIAIVCRIVVTGRAPVINIYSSAVFIGWAAVAAGLIVERLYRRGTGNILAACAGAMTLLVAYGLNTGDTMPVLQAVLDTQFWLSTHVISVSLGYVATMVAGLFGIGYLVAGWTLKDAKLMRELYRCCYGAACFGILFSFVGTVLGGLWADDSWGRFWGWDPKENGALLIVIWNALILHARWDGMVAARGFSVLAIGGNIVTAWSWFGTNELGIGLHSYGFTSGVLFWLTTFIFTQIAFIFAGVLYGRKPSDIPPPTASS